jgi:hypothetical protein
MLIYPTGGQQAIDWAKMILVDHMNPPQRVELLISGVFPDNAQDDCNQSNCPVSTGAADATEEVAMEATADATEASSVPIIHKNRGAILRRPII